MIKITIDQLKQNMVEMEDKENRDQLREEIKDINTLKGLVVFFDVEWVSSWDVHGLIFHALNHCVSEDH